MKKLIFTYIFLATGLIVAAQKDPAAKVYLDKVAEKSTRGDGLSVDFKYDMQDLADDAMNFSQSGKAILSGDKYKIIMDDSEIYYDGENLYNYIPDAEEVTVTKPDPDYSDVFLSNPSRIFTLYNEDFKYRKLREFKDAGKQLVEIDLIPEDLGQSYSRIRLHIDKNNNEIVRAKLFEKMGGRYSIEFDNYKTLSELEESSFTFNSAEHPNVNVIDMTDF